MKTIQELQERRGVISVSCPVFSLPKLLVESFFYEHLYFSISLEN